MNKEVELSDVILLGIVITTILALLKVLNILNSWWIVTIPVFLTAIVIIVCIIIAVVDEFRY